MVTKGSSLKVLTANRLGDGRVVYLNSHGWTSRLDEAQVLREAEEMERAEREGAAAVAERLVVEPYLVDVEIIDDGVVPARLRERIRADGPTTGNSRGRTDMEEAA